MMFSATADRPVWFTPYTACAWVKPAPADDSNCWIRPARENGMVARYSFADFAAC